MERLKRKLMIKVLSMQLSLSSKDSNFNGCSCSGDKGHALRHDVSDSLDPDDASAVFEGIEDDTIGVFEKYVWATGGHSASAGHGNLFNETYTAYMERDLKDVFASIGIDFEARNYAMGGTASATIISMCWKEVFGTDVDFFSWDYGMTDGGDVSSLLHYTYRGALSESRPAMMLIHYDGRQGRTRLETVKSLEEIGLAAFHGSQKPEQAMKGNFPDSAGLSTEDLDALPEYVRNYKCGTSIEKGDPFCGTEKFTKWGCVKRMKQTSWHPGYKDHAMIGHGLSLFLMEALLATVRDLSELEVEDTTLLLSQLLEEDIDLHNNFTNAELPGMHEQLLDLKKVTVGDGEPSIDASLFFKGKSMCHTARLPSQTRYLGILTDTNEVGQPAPYGEETYYLGHNMNEAKKTATENGEMRIVYEVSKERETECTGVTVKPDYPDSIYANSLDGWAKLKFPNAAEKRFYGYDPAEHQGIIILHIKKCDWGKCPANFLTTKDFANGDWEIKVNNQQITQVVDVDKRSGSMLKGENGFRFAPDENGQYEIEIKINKKNKYVEIADFALF